MKCAHVVICNLSTIDDKKELEANQETLFRKYSARKNQAVYKVGPRQSFPEDINDKATVGVYILSHTKDVVPRTLAEYLLKELKHANVKRINIACCRGALPSNNVMKAVCDELAKADAQAKREQKMTFLAAELLVCGFTVNVTTFGLGEEYTEKELTKNFANLEDIRAKGRASGTALMDWDSKTLTILHEAVGDGDAPRFVRDVENDFRKKIVKIWEQNKAEFVAKEAKIKDPKTYEPLAEPLGIDFASVNRKDRPDVFAAAILKLDWSTFFSKGTPLAKVFVAKLGWSKFLEKFSRKETEAAKYWKSLDEYAQRKKAMRYNGQKFVEVPLSEYSEKDDMRAALQFIEAAKESAGGAKDKPPKVRLNFLLT